MEGWGEKVRASGDRATAVWQCRAGTCRRRRRRTSPTITEIAHRTDPRPKTTITPLLRSVTSKRESHNLITSPLTSVFVSHKCCIHLVMRSRLSRVAPHTIFNF